MRLSKLSYPRLALAGLIGSALVGAMTVEGIAQDAAAPAPAPAKKRVAPRPKKPAAPAQPAAPAPTQQVAPAPPAVAPVPAPAAQAQPQPSTDPLLGDWKIVWLNKGNAVSQIHFNTIDRLPGMAAGTGTFAMQDGTQCRLDSGLAYQLYGQVPNGNQIMALNYTDVWKLVAHCPDSEVTFDLVAAPSNGQLNAIGRGVVSKNGVAPDSSFVLLQR
jgi:hypothetical protein